MHTRINPLVAGDRGAVQRPKGNCHITRGGRNLRFQIWLFLLFLFARSLPAFPALLSFSGDFKVENTESTFYTSDTLKEIAVCRTAKIFTDHGRLGFFHVQLLPQLVAQGVRLELAADEADGVWLESFQNDWVPDLKHKVMEWRDVTISLLKNNATQLHADRLRPAAAGTSVICTLENVVLTANGTTQRAGRAILRNENGRLQVVWHSGGGEQRWDLFTGKLIN